MKKIVSSIAAANPVHCAKLCYCILSVFAFGYGVYGTYVSYTADDVLLTVCGITLALSAIFCSLGVMSEEMNIYLGPYAVNAALMIIAGFLNLYGYEVSNGNVYWIERGAPYSEAVKLNWLSLLIPLLYAALTYFFVMVLAGICKVLDR